MQKKRILIVGGGASGLMAAIQAARNGADVTILEANDRPGRKLLASGNGKCNLTNLEQHPDCYRGSDPAFLWQIIRQFPAENTIAFFNALGLYTMNRDGWVYPVTEQAESVLRVLLLEAEHCGVRIKTREHVTAIRPSEDGLCTETDTWQYRSDAVILACGSPASAVRGSADTAQVIAGQNGLSFRPFMPALVPLNVKGDYCARWAGVRIHAAVTLLIDWEVRMREAGSLQLAAYGISGIPVFQISRFAVRAIRETHADVTVCLDLMPDYDAAELLARLEHHAARSPWKTNRQLLYGMLPEQMIPIVAGKKDSLAGIVQQIKRLPLNVTDAAPGRYAQVSSGGIDVRELGPDLQSLTVPGLFCAGEAVDCDGACGGYNLQWAWASGYVAGLHAAGFP